MKAIGKFLTSIRNIIPLLQRLYLLATVRYGIPAIIIFSAVALVAILILHFSLKAESDFVLVMGALFGFGIFIALAWLILGGFLYGSIL